MTQMCSIRCNHDEMFNCSGSQAVKKRKLSAGSIHIPTPVPLPQVRSEGWFLFMLNLSLYLVLIYTRKIKWVYASVAVILTDNCLEDAEILETVAQFGEELALIKWQDYRPNDWVTLLNTSKQPLWVASPRILL